MNRKIFFGIITTLIIILSSIPIIEAEKNLSLNDNSIDNIANIIKEKIYQNLIKIPKITWFPGFLITLLLAPFIILYLIIAIILDIGNPWYFKKRMKFLCLWTIMILEKEDAIIVENFSQNVIYIIIVFMDWYVNNVMIIMIKKIKE